MRKILVFLVSALLVAGCGGGSSSSFDNGGSQPTACSNAGQKQFVLDALYDWYLWNDLLPANIDIADYASPEELVFVVTTLYGPQDGTGAPIDRWSSVGSLQADQEYFGEGRYEGFGFSWREENGEMRMTGVFSGSPADDAGIARGQTVVSLDGRSYADIVANEGIGAFFDNNDTVEFAMQRLDATTYTASVTKDIVTIDAVPQSRIISLGEGVPPVGYIEFRAFISTADAAFDQIFGDFIAAGVKDVILDMRYNGGGLVRTAELLGDYLGGFANDGLVFSETEFNADRNPEFTLNERLSYFARQANSIDLTRLIVVASRSTASASELVSNALAPYADVWIVGDNTYGKPVGQVGIEFCEKILRPTSFRTLNADGYGDYFDGLPVDCPADDVLEVPVGADNDPNVVAALSISESGGCPVTMAPQGAQAPFVQPDIRYPYVRGNIAREEAGAY
jgi:carboxyl-terminal processing protease